MEAVLHFLREEGTEKYKSASYMNDEEAKNDPENEPYKSKYKAREIWLEIKSSLEEFKDDNPNDLMLVFLTAVIDLRLGMNYADTEETASGETHLEFCISSISDHKRDPKSFSILQNALNHLGILWTGRRNPKKALEYLQRSEAVYQDFKHDVGNAPWSVDELFSPDSDQDPGYLDQQRSSRFEDTYTHTLYYLAQVFTQLGENEKSAKYCHVTLQRQLETMKYQPMDWALNAATLSQYYITVQNFKLARHCLASATIILKELGEPVTKCEANDEDTQADQDAKEKLPRSWADLYRCWAKYGIALIELSKEKIASDTLSDEPDDHNADKRNDGSENNSATENTDQEHTDDATANDTDVEKQDGVFFNLEVTSMEEQITDHWLKNFEEARPVFLCVQRWLSLAKEFYILDGHCTDHVELIQDHSIAFKQLAFFEPDFDRQCKMHKRRIDMLQFILGDLSTQFYMMICRQLMFEIAETYSNMLDLKLAIIEETGQPPNEHAIKKINSLCSNSIDKFQAYIDSLKNSNKVLPDKLAEEDERPALVAFFYMGRLHSKYIQFTVPDQLRCTKGSLDCYNYLVNYCKKHPTAESKVATEYEICAEMVQLLPHKMEKIRQGALF